MWKFKYIFKNLKKSLGITFINVLGFSIGLSVIFYLVQYITNEYSYDKFHNNGERIYRVSVKGYEADKLTDETYVYTSEVGTDLKEEFPDIENFTTITKPKTDIFYLDKTPVKIEKYIYASEAFFDLFSFDLLVGNKNQVLRDPFSVVLTKKLADKLFEGKDPIGQQMEYNNDLYTVTGIAENPPRNTDVKFSMLVSLSSRYKQKNVYMGWNGGNQYIHYVKLIEGSSVSMLSEKFPSFMWKYINKDNEQWNIKDEIYLQPLAELHLHYNANSGSVRTGIMIFSIITLLLFAVVLINFINLFIADSARRLKTMGIIKLHGARKITTLKYLLIEISIPITVSVIIATVITSTFQTEFSTSGIVFNLIVVLIIFCVSILTALFPASLISAVQPIKILKNEAVVGKSGKNLKNGLVAFQFFISIFLIISTLTIQKQNRFMQQFNMGYNKDNILILPLQNLEAKQKSTLLKQEILSISNVKTISAVSELPYNGVTSNGYFPEGFDNPQMLHVIDVDKDFLELLDIPLVTGRNFSDEFLTDNNTFLINESLAKKLEWENPLGKYINRSGNHQVVGVVKDFNFASLNHNIKPLIISNSPESGYYNYLMVKISSQQIPSTIDEITKKWKSILPESPLEYSFFDQKFDEVYRSELAIQKLLRIFSLLTISIALLGLLGLSKFAVQSKIKEIGVRKVNGATIYEILRMLNSSYTILISVAFVLSAPVAWFAMQIWLKNYAYKTELSWWIFAASGLLALVVALLTVSLQSWRAARRNPVEALRYE